MAEPVQIKEMTLHLRTGAAVVVHVTDVTSKRNQLTGDLVSLEWTHPDPELYPGRPRLHSITVSAIEAITIRDLPAGGATDGR